MMKGEAANLSERVNEGSWKMREKVGQIKRANGMINRQSPFSI